MAGIGFKFRKLVHEGTYTGELKGYLFASIFAAGPWIMTMVIIGVLTILAPPDVKDSQLVIFRAFITYIYAFSLVVVGIFHLPLTRYLADKLFEENLSLFFSAYLDSLIITIILSIIPGSIFLYYNLGTPLLKLFVVLLFIVVSMIWIGMVFLSALRDYKFVLITFLAGSILSIVFSVLLKERWGLTGYIFGFFLGQLIIFSGISAELFREFNYERGFSFAFLSYMKKYPLLVLSGVSYNLGIWMDKLIIWNTPKYTESYYGNLHIYGTYDTAVFIAYLSVIPALGYFYAKVETSFYEVYRMYFSSIFTKNPLKNLKNESEKILYMVDSSLLILFKNQGTLTLLAFICSKWIVSLFGGSKFSLEIFRYALIGILFQILFLFCTIFMMYFEFYKELGFVNFLFFFLNGTLTWFVVNYTTFNITSGYVVSSFITFLITLFLLRDNLKKLIFITFTSQPLTKLTRQSSEFSSFNYLEKKKITPHLKFYKTIDSDEDFIEFIKKNN